MTDRLRGHIIPANVGPFSVEGFSYAVHSLNHIFDTVRATHPDLLKKLKQDGMLCVRHRRTNNDWSNHAFGCAIDLKYPSTVPGYEDGIDQGDHHTFQGLQDLYFFFHSERWYWGAGYSGNSVDAMHFEPSAELLAEWKQKFGPF